MAKHGMDVLEGGGAGRVAFLGAEHLPFLPIFPCAPTVAIPVNTKWCFWLRRSCNEEKAIPCWPWLQHCIGHGSSTMLAMAPAPRWLWPQGLCKIYIIHGENSGTNPISIQVKRWVPPR